jgi:FlaA1/EpsC-like NDP-sugar epimerase
VRDKELKTRHQLSVMGLPSHIYWLALFIHDCAVYSVPALGSVVIMVATKAEPMGRQALGPYTLLTCMFVPAMVMFSYILSFMYKKHLMVYQTIPLLLQLSSIGSVVAVTVLTAIPSTHKTGITINSICTYLLPHYTVIGASTFMQQQYIEDKLMGQERSCLLREMCT